MKQNDAFQRIFKEGIPFLGIFVLGGLIYAKTIFFDLTYLDDNVWMKDYHWFLKDTSNILRLFLQPDLISKMFYRPLIALSFMVNAVLGDPPGIAQHVTNIGIHLINASLVFILFKKLNYPRDVSSIVALIFTVHPALTQAVAWIPGRTDSLLALFVLSSFLFFIDFLRTKKKRFAFGHLVFLAFALLTKETAVVLPLMCGLSILIISNNENRTSRVLMIILWAGVVFLWYAIREMALRNTEPVHALYAVQSVFENSLAVISYAGKTLLPINLSVLPILKDTSLIFGFISIAILLIVLFLSRQKRISHLVFGLCWFLFFLMPALVISFLKHEYRLYLPIIGIFFIVLEVDIVKNLFSNKRNLWIVAGIIIALFSAISFNYSNHFRDALTFWRQAVQTSPHSPLAHRNLGAMYYLQGLLDEAEKEFKESLKLNPHEPMVHNNLGLILMDKSQYAEAEEEYFKEIAINPDYDNVYFNLGILYYRVKRFDEAVWMWKKTIELNPKYITAYRNLALYYVGKKDMAQAAYYFEELQKRGVTVSP